MLLEGAAVRCSILAEAYSVEALSAFLAAAGAIENTSTDNTDPDASNNATTGADISAATMVGLVLTTCPCFFHTETDDMRGVGGKVMTEYAAGSGREARSSGVDVLRLAPLPADPLTTLHVSSSAAAMLPKEGLKVDATPSSGRQHESHSCELNQNNDDSDTLLSHQVMPGIRATGDLIAQNISPTANEIGASIMSTGISEQLKKRKIATSEITQTMGDSNGLLNNTSNITLENVSGSTANISSVIGDGSVKDRRVRQCLQNF
jgi:hypothetical protein